MRALMAAHAERGKFSLGRPEKYARSNPLHPVLFL